MADSKRIAYIVHSPEGLHAREAARLARAIRDLDCNLTVRNGHQSADGRSVLSLLLLQAAPGTELEIDVAGPATEEAVARLTALQDGSRPPDATAGSG